MAIINIVPVSGLVTSESGQTAVFSVSLSELPSGPVTIHFSSSDTTEGVISPVDLVFTPSNWLLAQQITITGVDDMVDDGDIAYTIISSPAVSDDPTYNGVNAANPSATNTDNDTAGITIAPASVLQTSEAGGSATFTAVLNSQPTSNVSFNISSSDTTEGITSTNRLTFTPANWSTFQTVSVVGQDDLIVDGTVRYTINTGLASSNDPAYDRLNPANVSVDNADNDTVGITITPVSGLVTSESGGTATFTLVLTSQPTANVSISLRSSDTTEGTVAPSSLTFTLDNWSSNQTATVAGIDDTLDDGDIAYTVLTDPAVSTDPNYNGINPPNVSVTNLDNDLTLNAVDDTYSTNEDTALHVNSPGILANDSPGLINGLTIELVNGVSHGTLILHTDGALDYTPAANYNGPDTFTYRLRYGSSLSNLATVQINVNSVNDPPIATPDHFDTNATETTPLVIEAPGILSNDSDVDNGELLTVSVVRPPSNGSLNLHPDGSFVYQPNFHFNGLDTFSYLVSDGELNSNTTEVEIFVDIFPPVPVNWISPANNGELYHVKGETVSLQITTDLQDKDVARVRFYRWDPINRMYVEIGMVLQEPYQIDFNTRILELGWNQIFVQAYDKVGNASDRSFIWLIRENPEVLFLPILLR